MTTELPPEMIAVNEAMKMVFGALNTAPQGLQPIVAGVNPDPAVAAQISKKQVDAESAIMLIPGFGYLEAWELLACVQARLEHRYDNALSPKVERAFIELRKTLENAEELGRARHGEAW